MINDLVTLEDIAQGVGAPVDVIPDGSPERISGLLSPDEAFSPRQLRVIKWLCQNSLEHFARYFFRHRDNSKFIVNRHHAVICQVLELVYRGLIKRLVINIPPGYTKTELAVIFFIANGLARNPASKFMHISYSDQLALTNSSTVRDIVQNPRFQDLWPMELRRETSSKKAWYTNHRGGVYAAAAGGSITGFRAGLMTEGFSGAMIIDDPIKPDDAYSDTVRAQINNRFNNVFRSRLAHEDVPVIVIMQRIHEADPTNFLLSGGTGNKWHHLRIPSNIQDAHKGKNAEYWKEKYANEWRYAIPIDHKLAPGPLWPYKHSEDQLEEMEESDPYTYASQYDQDATPQGGGLFKQAWWQFYGAIPEFEYTFISGDTAQKTGEEHDYSCFGLFGVTKNKNLYMLDMVHGKWEIPELEARFVDFWNKYVRAPSFTGPRLRYALIEDKASGTALIQYAKTKHSIPVQAIQRNKDKVTRANDMVPFLSGGFVHLPDAGVIPGSGEWMPILLKEFRKFTVLMTHANDDVVDMVGDAIMEVHNPSSARAGVWGRAGKH